MSILFPDDTFLNACDANGALRADFAESALKARRLEAIPGGLPRWLEKHVGDSVLREALIGAAALEAIPAWVFQGVVRGVAHALAKAATDRWLLGDTSKPKRPWDASGGRDAEVAFVDFLDESLDQPDPLYSIRQRCDSTTSEGERAVCTALIERVSGDHQRAMALFQEVERTWAVNSGQLRQFIVLHHAIAAGGAGDFTLAVDLLGTLVKQSAPVPWIRLYALRYLLHYRIQYAWTRDTAESWRSVDHLLKLASPELKRSSLPHRVEKMRRSLLEFEAIREFKKVPTIAAANAVKKKLEWFGSLSPTYRRIRAAPLAILYLRASAPDEALEEATAYLADLPNDMERGVARLVQAQAYARRRDLPAAFNAADAAAAYLSPERSFLQELCSPSRFGRLATMYRAMYGEATVVERAKAFAFSVLGPARLYGPFVSASPNAV